MDPSEKAEVGDCGSAKSGQNWFRVGHARIVRPGSMSVMGMLLYMSLKLQFGNDAKSLPDHRKNVIPSPATPPKRRTCPLACSAPRKTKFLKWIHSPLLRVANSCRKPRLSTSRNIGVPGGSPPGEVKSRSKL